MKNKRMRYRLGFPPIQDMSVKSSPCDSCQGIVLLSKAICTAFDYVSKSARWICFVRIELPKNACPFSRGCTTMHQVQLRLPDKLSLPFVASNGVRCAFLPSPFLFSSAREDIMQNALSGLLNDGVEVLSEETVLA